MGVRKLLQLVELFGRHSKGPDKEVLPRESTLLVDGNGLLFYILSTAEGIDYFRKEYCGNYAYFDYLIKKIVNNWRNNDQNINFVIYFDGKSKMKDKTIQERALRREKMWITLHDKLRDKSIHEVDQNDLPIPKLIIKQFRQTLFALGLTIVECNEEVDQELARICFNGNTKNNTATVDDCDHSFFVLGQDSDYLVFKGCPYIPFNQLHLENNSLTAFKIWRRHSTAISLGLSEAQFIELAILLGNDYTGSYSRALFRQLPLVGSNRLVLNQCYKLDYYMSIASHLAACDLNWQSSSDNIMLQEAIQFSRKLYDLHDLSEYPYDEMVVEDHMHLNGPQKLFINQLISEAPLCTPDVDAIVSLVMNIFEKCIDDNNFDVQVKPEHKSVLTKMNSILKDKALSFDLSGYMKRIEQRLVPLWEDLYVANLYQNCIGEVLSKLVTAFPGNDNLLIFRYFDGLLFHELMQSEHQLTVTNFSSLLTKLVISQDERNVSTITTSVSVQEELPIDKHKDTILQKLGMDRVVIIHGETGCGKSSRLPIILYEDLKKKKRPCRMMISQPRRIAASALMKRLRGVLGSKVGMRMGHGVKDEHDDTDIFFVTTGYIVRLMAFHPEFFNDHTHLIIDEVHERSIDGDVLCFLARKLLYSHPTIKIILMSATIHTSLYKTYFNNGVDYFGDMECLSVGVRRFPVTIHYLEDIVDFTMKTKVRTLGDIINRSSGNFDEAIPITVAKEQYAIAVSLVRSIGVKGSGILIFVSGINDIYEITEKLSGVSHYKVFIIHSEIPFEEQEAAFLPAGPDEVKVIVATNAAESSITLPDVDCVICLGTHKAIRYVSSTHRTQLANCWISKASATQRAGRTGRVRPGLVYRLYSKKLYEKFQDHDCSEVQRTPMQDVILNLRVMFDSATDFNGVSPILQSLLEPPDVHNVHKSFEYLHSMNMITSPDDDCELTALGRFAGQMPVDLVLSKMVANGISMNVGAFAAILAMAVSQPKSMFRIASPMIHRDPDVFNEIFVSTLMGAESIDRGDYSEPIMYVKAFIQFVTVSDDKKREQWCWDHGLVYSRFKYFVAATKSLILRINTAISKGFRHQSSSKAQTLSYENLNLPLTKQQLLALRLILCWNCDGNFLRMKQVIDEAIPSDTVIINAPTLSDDHLLSIFPSSIKWSLNFYGQRIYDAQFSQNRGDSDFSSLLRDLLICSRFSGRQTVPMVCCYDKHQLILLLNDDKISADEEIDILKIISGIFKDSIEYAGNFRDKLDISLLQGKSEIIGKVFLHNGTPSSKCIRKMKEFISEKYASMYLNILPSSNPKLSCCQFLPDMDALKVIFFADDAYRLSGEPSSEMEKKYKIAEQVIGAKQILKFSDDEVIEDQQRLLNDLPMGHRIINALRLGYRSKKFLVRKEAKKHRPAKELKVTQLIPSKVGLKGGMRRTDSDKDDLSKKAADKTIIPGTAEYAKQQRYIQESAVDGDSSTTFDESNIIEVECKSNITNWSYFNMLTKKMAKLVSIQRQTLAGAAAHKGNQMVYAVAQKSLDVKLASGGDMVVCESITFLPPGSRFIRLALLCSPNYEPANINDIVVNDQQHISDDEIEQCFEIRNILGDVGKVEQNDALISRLDNLFLSVSASYSVTKNVKSAKGTNESTWGYATNNVVSNEVTRLSKITGNIIRTSAKTFNDRNQDWSVESFNNSHMPNEERNILGGSDLDSDDMDKALYMEELKYDSYDESFEGSDQSGSDDDDDFEQHCEFISETAMYSTSQTLKALGVHEDEVQSKKINSLKCLYCSKTFNQQLALNAHTRAKHMKVAGKVRKVSFDSSDEDNQVSGLLTLQKRPIPTSASDIHDRIHPYLRSPSSPGSNLNGGSNNAIERNASVKPFNQLEAMAPRIRMKNVNDGSADPRDEDESARSFPRMKRRVTPILASANKDQPNGEGQKILCTFCNRPFKDAVALQQHQAIKHAEMDDENLFSLSSR